MNIQIVSTPAVKLAFSSGGVMTEVLGYGSKVREFKFQSHCYVHLGTSIVRKGKVSLVTSSHYQ